MTWVRIDDHFDQNPKLAQVGPLGMALWVSGLAYCNRNLTDGFIPWATSRALLAWEFLGVADEFGKRRYRIGVATNESMAPVDTEFVVQMLTDAGLWDEVDGGYRVHDYADFQPSRDEVLEERAKTRERVSRFRKRDGNDVSNAVGNAVTNGHVTLPPVPDPVPTSSKELVCGADAPTSARTFEGMPEKPARKPRRTTGEVVPLSLEDLQWLHAKWDSRWGQEEVAQRITLATSHVNHKKYPENQRGYVDNWLSRDAKSDDERRERFTGSRGQPPPKSSITFDPRTDPEFGGAWDQPHQEVLG